MKQKLLTLAFVVDGDRILLGMKKRGFGAGRWNGFGGKVGEGETIEEAAIRETREECGLEILALEKVGLHMFVGQQEADLEVHVFRVAKWQGELVETEEMRPQWFPIGEIPYDTMWPDDQYWFPLFLAGKKFRTQFLFDDKDRILEQEVKEVTNFDS